MVSQLVIREVCEVMHGEGGVVFEWMNRVLVLMALKETMNLSTIFSQVSKYFEHFF